MEVLLLIGVLVFANAVLAGSEMAYVSLRAGQIRRLQETGPAGERLAQLANEPSQLLSTVQVGITLGGFLASAAAAVSIAEPIVPYLGFFGDAAEIVAVILVTMVLTYVTLVLGELVPKRIAQQRPERWALLAARPLGMLAAVSAPVVWLLARSTDAVVRLVGFDPRAQQPELTEEEVRDFIAHDRHTPPTKRQILRGAFELDERTVRQVLVPRRDTVAVSVDMPARDALDRLVASGHSRCPVLDDDAGDQASSVVHVRDLITADPDAFVRAVARPAPVIPDSTRVLDLLRMLQRERQQLALVANEHGSFIGIVTVEDILEEIVGEIYDEFDRDVGAGDAGSAQRRPDGSWSLPGRFPLHDLPDIGIDISHDGSVATVAGLILDVMERIPGVGEHVGIDGWTFTVESIDRNAIADVSVRRSLR